MIDRGSVGFEFRSELAGGRHYVLKSGDDLIVLTGLQATVGVDPHPIASECLNGATKEHLDRGDGGNPGGVHVIDTRSDPTRVTLEITEGALIADFNQATARLKQLRELGVRISIDDFGTGYSSLSYFKKIPADELKIDKSFVIGMLAEEADQRLVATIITLARQFKLDVVAEGVENQATLELLASMGCDYAQGYLFAPALNAEQLGVWLRRNSDYS